MEVLRYVNYVLISQIELSCINLGLISIIVIIICTCQMFQAHDGMLLNQVVILLAYDLCVRYMCMLSLSSTPKSCLFVTMTKATF